MSNPRSRASRSPIAKILARGLGDRRGLMRKLIVGDAIGERPQPAHGMVMPPGAAPGPGAEPGDDPPSAPAPEAGAGDET